MPQALIALGSNLGDRKATLERAISLLQATPGVEGLRASEWRATLPIGGPPGQGEFLNGAAVVSTSLAAGALAQRLSEVEIELGRERTGRWGPRTVDLDLLLYDGLTLEGPLRVPHPRMVFRRFVLEPASEIAGEMVHPTIGWTIEQLRDHLRTAPDYVAISGIVFEHTRQLAADAAKEVGWRLIEVAGAGDTGRPVGSPSFTKHMAIRFLEEQADLLGDTFRTQDAQPAMSSFWIEDLLAIGDVLWPGELDEVWESMTERIVTPKLLVVYQASVPGSASESGELWGRLQDARRRRAARRGIGPVLWLAADDPGAALSELVAAIQSM